MRDTTWRQKLHLEPPQGWLNDPNGLSFYGGRYHVYFQYAPDSASGGGRKCWGHYESRDLIHWDFTGTVLVPDISEDRDGVYSGSAVVTEENLQLFYTGNVKEEGDYDYITAGRGANVIRVQTPDGVTMGEKEVLLRNSDYPDDCSCHVRDPKVWRENGCWNMVLGARTLKDEGCVLYYTSKDLKHWSYQRREMIPDFGFMWECPDFFRIEGRPYLSVSPQGLPHEQYRNQNVYSSGYFHYDGEQLVGFTEWDYGFDFYAPQSFEAPDGRRLLIGWMGIGDIPYHNPTEALGWQHCLTLPREISRAEDGELIQRPMRELENLRREQTEISAGQSHTFTAPFELLAEAERETEIWIGGLRLCLSGENAVLDFTDEEIGAGRQKRCARIRGSEKTSIRMIVDRSSVEVYLNGGRVVMSSRFYPRSAEIAMEIHGCNASVYKLEEMEVHINGE